MTASPVRDLFDARELSNVVSYLGDVMKLPLPTTIEHAVDRKLLTHELLLTIPPQTAAPRLLVLHPDVCGCDALPLEIMVHG